MRCQADTFKLFFARREVTLHIEVFIQNITYLPFSDVISVCNVNNKLHNYCTNDKYKLYWKQLIYNLW